MIPQGADLFSWFFSCELEQWELHPAGPHVPRFYHFVSENSSINFASLGQQLGETLHRFFYSPIS